MASTHQVIPLTTGWRYKSEGGPAPHSVQSWAPACPLPTTIHLDLLANGVIADPFEAKNEETVQWVSELSWMYETSFTVPTTAFQIPTSKIELVFEGLDTYATVALNGREILQSNNMFLSHRVDITREILTATGGEHHPQTLTITFESADQRGEEKIAEHPEHDWFALGAINRLATRKAQYHYGWDWGPVLVTCGPWKPIYLEVFDARITDLSVRPMLSSDLNEVELQVCLGVIAGAEHANIEIERNNKIIASERMEITGEKASRSFFLSNPELWWPYTLGVPALYRIRATIIRNRGGREEVLDVAEKNFGIRKIEILQRRLKGEEGTSFYFQINHIPIFAAGSCWIPADFFTPRITPEIYRKWIQLVQGSNQVMIRIWGGGIYEHDAFYDACDEMGILVWQDFMFACGMYPAYPEMQKTIREEAAQVIKRIRHHPSIALWCGNNEDYVIPVLRKRIFDEGDGTYDHTLTDQEKILQSPFPARVFYEHILPAICRDLVPDVPYWPGSPFGGPMANSETAGDIHQWHVWHMEKFPYQAFPRLSGRFVSEFGMQAVPCLRTTQAFFPRDYQITRGRDFSTDEHMEFHNKAPSGAETLFEYVANNVQHGTNSLRQYIYCTQLVQSEALSTAYRSWRRLWRGPGQEYCSGALVWQLNDCWPVTSWAVIDYHLRPKMAFWAIKRENRPVTVSLARVYNGDSLNLEAWATNMTLAELAVDIQIVAWDVKNGARLWTHTMHTNISLLENRSTELGTLSLDEMNLRGSSFRSGANKDFYTNVVFAAYLFAAQSPAGAERPALEVAPAIAQHINFHEPLCEVGFQSQPRLSANILKHAGTIYVELNSPVPVKGIFLDVSDVPDVEWEDNGVDIVPGRSARIAVTGLDIGQERRLDITWHGAEWPEKQERSIKHSL